MTHIIKLKQRLRGNWFDWSDSALRGSWGRTTRGWLTMMLLLGIILGGSITAVGSTSAGMLAVGSTSAGMLAVGSTSAQKDSLFVGYLREAYINSGRMHAAFESWTAALQTGDQLGALPDPEVMLQYYFNPMERVGVFAQGTIGVQQVFPWFGSRAEAREYGGLLAQARLEAMEAVRLEVFAQVREVWFAVHAADRMQSYLREHLDWVVRLERLTRSRLETGYASRSDVLRLEMERMEIESELRTAGVMLRGQIARFNVLLGRDPANELTLVTGRAEDFLADLPIDGEVLPELGGWLGEHPRVREMEVMRQAGASMQRRARLEGYPMIGVGAELMGSNYLMRMPDGSSPFVAQVSVSLPIWRSKYRAAAEQARAETRMFEREKDAMVQELSGEIAMAWSDYLAAQEQVRRYRDQLIPRSRELTDLLLLDYSGGRARLEEVIMARRESVNYAISLEEAVLAYNQAVGRIESLTGAGFAGPSN
jgi:outer membrane protein, heavy metal efflux system